MASSSAACVFGGVRLTSSASSTFVKIGPGTKVQRRCPVVMSSSMMSVPVTSVGIRSGVNWMRLNFRPSAMASVRTSSVFAVPGMPVIKQWPPTSSVSSRWSTTSSCPTMILRTSVRIAPSREWNVSTWRSTSASVSLLAATSFIFGSLLDDLQQEVLRRFVMGGGDERIEHVTATRGAITQRVQGAGGAEQRLRLIVILQCKQHSEFAQRVFGAVVRQQAFAELRVLLGIERIGIVQRLQDCRRIAAPSCFVEPARQLAQCGRIPAAGVAICLDRSERLGTTAQFVERTRQQQIRGAGADVLRIQLGGPLGRCDCVVPLLALNRLARGRILRLPFVHAGEYRAVARLQERAELLIEVRRRHLERRLDRRG